EWIMDDMWMAGQSCGATPLGQFASVLGGCQIAGWQSPIKDLNSRVNFGEVLLEIDVPELVQDVAQKESLLKQCEAELLEARASVASFEAGVVLQTKLFLRTKDLVDKKIVAKELLDEKEAELALVSSKLATARAEIMVKESRVRVARDEVRRAQIMANYTQIRAPFDGVITFRGVDEGDFIQNASSGHTRPLMTVTAINK